MMPAFPCLPPQAGSREIIIIIGSVPSTMPARHRERYSTSLRNLSTIRP